MASSKSPKQAARPPSQRKKPDKSFVFREIVNIIKSTGLKASTLRELREHMDSASDESIFHHTYQYFLSGHIQEHTNDFAHWASESLEESALAEHFSNVDPYSFKSISALRTEFLRVIDEYLAAFPEPRQSIPGHEFYFCESVSYVFPSGIKARNLAEFLMAIKYLDASSIYYHFFEARTRLRKESDDFSKWIKEVMKAPDIADKLRAIDPFMSNLDGIREQIILALEDGIRSEMEVRE